MVKSFKYRLRPTGKQEKILLVHIEECRLLYNQLVASRVQAYENSKASLSCYDQQKMLPVLKHQHNGFVQVYSQVLQQVAVRVDLAFKAFFRRLKEKAKTGEKAGFPRYKGQKMYEARYDLNGDGAIGLDDFLIFVSSFGKRTTGSLGGSQDESRFGVSTLAKTGESIGVILLNSNPVAIHHYVLESTQYETCMRLYGRILVWFVSLHNYVANESVWGAG